MGGLFFALLISGFAGVVVAIASSWKKERATRGGVFAGFLVAIVIFVVLGVLSSWTQVEYGTVAVVTRFGAVTGRIFRPGPNWKTPFIEGTVVYSTQKITYETSENPDQSNADYTDYQVDTTTQDGQQIKVRYTVRFRVDEVQASWVAQNLGDETALVEKVVKTDTRIHSRNVAREFRAAQLYTGNVEEYQDAVAAKLNPLFKANGLILDEFGVRSIIFEQDYADAIEQKQIEAEKVATERYRALQETERKKGTITKAEAAAEQRRIKAQGDADANVIEATAEAQAVEMVGNALRESPEFLDLERIKTLNPKIRLIIPSNSPFILGEGILEEAEETP